ncbi:MAG: D-glycero-beta-D-manno-heptose 1-phosphate adenylyltransferase [Acidobacteriota bacterium]|nr:MAG: D-glycero-beta-D-manno-heptose 1-phosphate adenylyltransferase [Acidobacteriota bacterium]
MDRTGRDSSDLLDTPFAHLVLWSIVKPRGSVSTAREKVKERQALVEAVDAARQQGRRIVFTNGCFDIIHPGHIRYLETARSLGDLLVVAVNSDESVRRLKGESRPIQDEDARSELVAALHCVDLVGIFSEDTPLEIIMAVRPDTLVKGGDWTKDQIVGRDFVEARGGEVFAIEFEQGYSTTNIIERIRESQSN